MSTNMSVSRFGNRSLRYMSAYRMGMHGKEAVWAARKYHGHRCLPPGALQEVRQEFQN
jgi:hypothetical protein